MRHRLGRNVFRFLCETHLELPPQPPPGCRTLVLFAHFDLHGFVDPYVAYYLKALHGLGATIVFVSGSPSLEPELVGPIRSRCAGIYTRRTLSLDFGCWHLAWCILRERGWSLDQFDRFVFANDSVFGPRSGRNNGTRYFGDSLIEDFRFPFLKTVLARSNKLCHVSMVHLREVIEQHMPLSLPSHPVERGQAPTLASRRSAAAVTLSAGLVIRVASSQARPTYCAVRMVRKSATSDSWPVLEKRRAVPTFSRLIAAPQSG